MTDARKCRTMPNGEPSVLTFLVVELNEDDDTSNVSFFSMTGWHNFNCEEIYECPEDLQSHWDNTEQIALEVIWNHLKVNVLGWPKQP